MPATWSKYDDQPLPNPKDNKGDSSDSGDDPGPSKGLRMNWTSPHTPKDVPGDVSALSGAKGATGGGGDDNFTDNDGNYSNGRSVGLLPEGTPYNQTGPEFDWLVVNTDSLFAWEQNMLSAVTGLVGEFNDLRDRSQNIATDPMWGRGEGTWQRQETNYPDNVNNTLPFFLPSNSAVAARKFTDSIGPTLQGALQNAADMITLSGMLIEVLDATISSYAQMDQFSAFPDIQDLKKPGGN